MFYEGLHDSEYYLTEFVQIYSNQKNRVELFTYLLSED